MSFSATPNVVGVPDFNVIHIDPEEVAKCFQTYLDTASKLTGVSIDDISMSVYKLPDDQKKATLVELLQCGMKLFDAIVWITAGRPAENPLQIDAAMKASNVATLHEVARAIFYCYFMLIVQARYPSSRSSTDKPKIPNFLTQIMGLDKEQHVYVETVCSFEPQKFDPAWARFVSFRHFGQEVLSRFGLGVAGYRYFGPFALYSPKKGLSAEQLNAFEFAKSVAKANASWSVHPLTRDANILTRRGNLNKNLGNLILECFTDEDIESMVTAKVIFRKPVQEPTHRQYKQWSTNDDITGSDYIFKM
jgi:hypothetical protein